MPVPFYQYIRFRLITWYDIPPITWECMTRTVLARVPCLNHCVSTHWITMWHAFVLTTILCPLPRPEQSTDHKRKYTLLHISSWQMPCVNKAAVFYAVKLIATWRTWIGTSTDYLRQFILSFSLLNDLFGVDSDLWYKYASIDQDIKKDNTDDMW